MLFSMSGEAVITYIQILPRAPWMIMHAGYNRWLISCTYGIIEKTELDDEQGITMLLWESSRYNGSALPTSSEVHK